MEDVDHLLGAKTYIRKIDCQKSHNFWTKLTEIEHSVEAVRAHAQCSARIWRLYTSLLLQTA